MDNFMYTYVKFVTSTRNETHTQKTTQRFPFVYQFRLISHFRFYFYFILLTSFSAYTLKRKTL